MKTEVTPSAGSSEAVRKFCACVFTNSVNAVHQPFLELRDEDLRHDGGQSSEHGRGRGARRDARVHDPQPPRATAMQDVRQPAREQLTERDVDGPDVTLLAQAHGETLGLHLAEEDGDADLDPGHVERHVDARQAAQTLPADLRVRVVSGRRPTTR